MTSSWDDIHQTLSQLIQFHQHQLLKTGQRIIPHLTQEDLWQPNDYPELENHPYFRYEEGMLAGIQTVQMALQALEKQKNKED